MKSLPFSNRWPLTLIRRHRLSTSEAGLTLIECVMAIVVLGIVGASIAPMLVISVATRINSQKSEQALQLAQSEVDRIRVLVERGEGNADVLPPDTGAATAATAVAAPDTLEATLADVDAVTDARQVDLDGDGEADFALQAYTTKQLVNGDGVPQAFDLGVRVYDIRAFDAGQALSTEEASLGLTNNSGDRRRQPLAVLNTTVAYSESGQSFCNYIEFADSTAEKPLGCD